MQTDWETAIAFVLKEEGGEQGELVEHDRGGYTKFGISTAAHPKVDIPNLTRDGAIKIYKEEYWNACHCDELPSPLAIAVFDSAVNQGVGAACRMLQVVVNVQIDGIIGQETVGAAFKRGPKATRQFLAQRMVRYIDTIISKPSQRAFAENWASRLMRLAVLVFTPKEAPTNG